MKETAVQVNERKIRNGIRKQAEKIWREKQKVWDRLKSDGKRKLRGDWTIEEAEYLKSAYGMDLEDVLVKALTAEIAVEMPARQHKAWEDKVQQDLIDFLKRENNK